MIGALLKGIMDIVIGLVNIVLSPIDALMTSLLPDVANLFGYISGYFNLALQVLGFVLDTLLIPDEVLAFIALYYVFKLTVPYTIYTMKFVIAWYNNLKL